MVAVTERRWPVLVLTPIQISNYIVTVTDTVGLHVKQQVTLSLGSLSKDFEIKRVISKTQLKVGQKQELKGSSFSVYSNPTEFDGGTLTVVEQERNKVSWDIVGRSVYAEEPIVALRNVLVDRYGEYYTTANPLDVRLSDGSISIGTVEANLDVQLTHLDNWPTLGEVNDSVRIGSGIPGEYLTINHDGSINVVTAELLKYKIINLNMPLANMTYTQTIPANIRRFTVKVRDSKGPLRIYESSLSSDFLTVSRGTVYDSGTFKNPSLDLVVQSSQADCVLEIMCWVTV